MEKETEALQNLTKIQDKNVDELVDLVKENKHILEKMRVRRFLSHDIKTNRTVEILKPVFFRSGLFATGGFARHHQINFTL